MTSIKLSPKHGLNTSLEQCYYCCEPKGVILAGRLPGDAEAPKMVCISREPCQKCAGLMKLGVILISVRDGETGNNPHRTGGWCVVKDEVIGRLIKSGDLADHILRARATFIPHSVWNACGLPKLDGGDDAVTKH